MPNTKLAKEAVKNLTDNDISPDNRIGGHCAGFARETVWDVYGEDSGVSPPSGLDAVRQYQWFKKRGYAVPLKNGSVVGDLLYKFGGAHGHVMIRIPGNKVAENSSVHGIGPDEDARGTRTLKQIGTVEGIVRLPSK